MGRKNYLIEGVSCVGKTSVCAELQRRGYHALNTDRDLAYKGDPKTGVPLQMPVFKDAHSRADWVHNHQIWDVGRVRQIVADHDHPATFLCGGSRNFDQFIDLFDSVFILDVDRATLINRLALRVDEWGSAQEERDLVLRLHATRESIPRNGCLINAARPVEQVVDAILEKVEATKLRPGARPGRGRLL